MNQANPTRKSFFTISGLLICPRCIGFMPNNRTPGAHSGAVSRTDKKTKICSACGIDEVHEISQNGHPTSQGQWPYTDRMPYAYEGKTLDDWVEEVMNVNPHWEALDAYQAEIGWSRPDTDLASFERAFLGKWESFKDYVQHSLDECGLLDDLPDQLVPYFDIDRFAHDVEMDGKTFAIDTGDGSVWMFVRP